MTVILPSAELQAYIRKVINEDINTRDRDLEAIKEWLRKQPHLPDTWDDQCILSFLRGCSFSLEKCKRKLDMHFTVKAAVPEFFTNRDITRAELQKVLNIGEMAIVPHLTPEGRRVSIVRGKNTEYSTSDMVSIMKLVFMAADLCSKEYEFGVSGEVLIYDAAGTALSNFITISPIIVKKYFVCGLQGYAFKIKEIHVINPTPFVDFAIQFLKPLLKKKLRDRIRIHSDLESLHKFVPQQILPEEYGGSAGRLSDLKDQWVKKCEEYKPWFDEQESIKSDESKRSGERINCDDLFGLHGSFKQLNID